MPPAPAPDGPPRFAGKVRSCLASLVDVAAALRRLQDAGVATLCARLTPRLRSATNAFEGGASLVSYELTEEAFGAAAEGSHAPFAAEFLPVLASIVAPYRYALTPALSAAVAVKTASYVAKQLESRVRRKRFNQLGALQFDTDVRALAAFFAERASRRVREKFTRLRQIARLLTAEAPAEVLEWWGAGAGGRGGDGGGDGGVPWELSPEEIRGVLALRVEFSPADVAALKL